MNETTEWTQVKPLRKCCTSLVGFFANFCGQATIKCAENACKFMCCNIKWSGKIANRNEAEIQVTWTRDPSQVIVVDAPFLPHSFRTHSTRLTWTISSFQRKLLPRKLYFQLAIRRQKCSVDKFIHLKDFSFCARLLLFLWSHFVSVVMHFAVLSYKYAPKWVNRKNYIQKSEKNKINVDDQLQRVNECVAQRMKWNENQVGFFLSFSTFAHFIHDSWRFFNSNFGFFSALALLGFEIICI